MIHIDQKTGCFHLRAGDSSYVVGILDGRYLIHGYWGPALETGADLSQLITLGGRPYSVVEDLPTETAIPYHRTWFSGADAESGKTSSTTPAPGASGGPRSTAGSDSPAGLSDRRRQPADSRTTIERLPLEYPVAGTGDLRSPALVLRFPDGTRCGRLAYSGHEVLEGIPGPAGLPYVSAPPEKCETLRIDLVDPDIPGRDSEPGLAVSLYYLPLPDLPVILRWAEIRNGNGGTLTVEAAASASMDLPRDEADVITLDGSWSKERHFHRRPAAPGLQQVQSRGGSSGHHHSPFMAVAGRDTTEEQGCVRSMSLIYSGNHRHALERDRYGTMRFQAGINPDSFAASLAPGESFATPAAVLTWSGSGLTGLSDAHHGFVRNWLTREEWRDRDRPIIANTWEAHYFDVNRENVVALAAEAKAVGAEVLVLDDGWFKGRSDDKRALGDWIPEESKFPGGLGDAVRDVRELGLGFGLWVEPEMVNPESELFARHPEWILRAGKRSPVLARNQLVLDLSRPKLVDYLLDLFSGIFSSAPITYVKWDMNRNMAEIGNADLPIGNQGEVAHRYMLGLYRLWSQLTSRFPHILFEGCAGGGGRFDYGSLAFMPQFWTSDQTDAIERQRIQFGTSLLFPPETMGSHVSAVPNHQVGRITPPETRGLTALAFNFGYELDLASETPEDRGIYTRLSELYRENRQLFRTGRFRRLLPAPRAAAADTIEAAPSNRHAWSVVAADGSEAMAFFFQTLAEADDDGFRLKLRGLSPGAAYRDEATGAVFDAALLENLGLWLPPAVGDYRSAYWKLTRVPPTVG